MTSIKDRIRQLEEAKKQKDNSSNNVYSIKPIAPTQPLSTQQLNQAPPSTSSAKNEFLYIAPQNTKPQPAASVQSAPNTVNVNNVKKMFEELANKKQAQLPKQDPPQVTKQVKSGQSQKVNPLPQSSTKIIRNQSIQQTSSSGDTNHIADFPAQNKITPLNRILMTGTTQPHRTQHQPPIQRLLSQKQSAQIVKPSQIAGKKMLFAMFEDKLQKQKPNKDPLIAQNTQKPQNIEQRTQNVINRMFSDAKKNSSDEKHNNNNKSELPTTLVNEQATDSLINRGVGAKKNKKKKAETFDNL